MSSSIHEDIQRSHLERAKQLRAETDLRTPDVATASGYGSASYLPYVLRQQLSMTPVQYRAHVRGR